MKLKNSSLTDISIVIPLFNEEESLPELIEWISRVTHSHGFSYEIILVDDGSSDASWQVVEELQKNHPIKGIRFSRNYGKSAALNTASGMLKAKWLLPWMLIYKIVQTRFPNSTR